MSTRRQAPRSQPQHPPRRASTRKDRGAAFDGALARGLELPKGLPAAEARAFYVEHARDWTERDRREWQALRLRMWRARQDDPAWKAMRSEIAAALERARAFHGLGRMRLLHDPRLVRDKIVEALADALDALRFDARRRADGRREREIAEGDLQDATDRMGIDRELFSLRKAAAVARLSELAAEEERERSRPGAPPRVMDDLALDLFAIARHVTPRRSVSDPDGVSDRRLHAEAVKPILRAFASVDDAIPQRTSPRGRGVEAAPHQRVKRALTARERQSAAAADLWRDGRQALPRAELVAEARALLFSWDSRFPEPSPTV